MKSKKARLLLLLVPLLLFILGKVYIAGEKFHYGANSDPEYAYLFNSLNILKGTTPFHVDHPGTPLQLLGAAVIAVKGAFLTGSTSSDRIVFSVLQNPEAYLGSIHVTLLALFSLAVWLTASALLKSTGSLMAPLLFQAGTFCYFQIQIALERMSPEPILTTLCFALMAVLTPAVFENRPESERKRWFSAAAVGAVVGIGIAVKVTFVPLAVTIFLLDRWKERAIALAGAVTAFVFATFPIWPRYRRMYDWYLSLLTHQEKYGHGAAGLPDVETLLANAKMLLAENPFLPVALVFYLILIVFLRPRLDATSSNERNLFRLVSISLLALGLQIAITIKHPGSNYLVPSMALTVYTYAVAGYLLFAGGASRKLSYAVSAIVLAGAVSNGYTLLVWHDLDRKYNRSVDRLLTVVDSTNCVKVGYYRSSLPGFALGFGNEWSGWRYGDALQKLHPDTLMYSVWDRQFRMLNGDVVETSYVSALLRKGTCFLLTGTRGALDEQTELACEEIYSAGDEAVYRLREIRTQ